MPVKAGACGIEPPVSVPVAPRHSPAATAEAEPPEDPPGTSGVLAPLRRQGEITGPKNEVSFDEPMANSSLLSLPSITAPTRQRLELTADSSVGTKFSRMCEQAVVRTSLVANMSLMPSASPSSGRASPAASRASAASAIVRARCLNEGNVRIGQLDGGEFSSAKPVPRLRERQRCELAHSSGLSQENAAVERSVRCCLATPVTCAGPPAAGLGNGRPIACKSSVVTPGGISPRARKSAHHTRKKYSCSSQARHIGDSHSAAMAELVPAIPSCLF